MQKIDINSLKIKSIGSIGILNTDDEISIEIDLQGVELERLFDVLIGNFGFDGLIEHLEKKYNKG